MRWTFAFGVCLVLVLSGIVFALYGKSKFFQTISSSMLRNPLDVIRGKPLASYKPETYLADHPHTMNILFLGCDRDYVGKRINGNAVPVPVLNSNGRSDAIMIAHYDFDKKTLNILTIPRDTAVHIPDHGTHKINAAHQYGGPALTQETIKSVFGIDVDAYVTLHFEAFQQIVDAVDGVNVTVKKDLNYDDNWGVLHVHLKKGYQHMNGYQAMGYVRFRHDDSDLMRAERQHDFVEAMRQQIKSPKMLLRGAVALNTISDNLNTSLSYEQLITLAAWTKELPKESIVLATMPSIEGPVYVTVNKIPASKMIAQMFFEGNESAFEITAPDKQAVYAMNHRGARRRVHGRSHDFPITGPGSEVPTGNDSSSGTSGSDLMPEGDSAKPDAPGIGPKPGGGATPPEKKSSDSGDKTKDPPQTDPTSTDIRAAMLPFA